MHQNILRHTHLFISIYRSLFLATTFGVAVRILECTGAFQLNDRKLELANCRASIHSRMRSASSKVVAKNKLRLSRGI